MAYKGINTLILRAGAQDLFWKAGIQELDQEEVALDIHHIFPKAWCEGQGIKADVYDSIINKTPISYKANRMIGGKAPSEYLKQIQEHKQVGLENDSMNVLLESHYIHPKFIRMDDFQCFMTDRKERLLALVGSAMNKSVNSE